MLTYTLRTYCSAWQAPHAQKCFAWLTDILLVPCSFHILAYPARALRYFNIDINVADKAQAYHIHTAQIFPDVCSQY